MQEIIKIDGLTKYYGKNCAMKDISFSVEAGEIFGFIGPNGAGKSTLIRTLLGLQQASSGTACIFGEDIGNYAQKIAHDVGYLPSEVFYYDGMKVKDLLKYSASFYKKDCSKRTAELCHRLDLDVNRKINDLSYGNRKKVGIVQALLHEPKLLVLDEPTGGLDPLMQQTFFEILEEESQKGTTIFLSSHILSEVQRLCNRVAIIKEGSIISLNKFTDFAQDNYKKIHISLKTDDQLELPKLEGISNYQQTKDKIDFLYKGEMNPLIKVLSQIDVFDVSISEPSLEEIFLHYYE